MLELRENRISDIGALSGLTNLEVLDLSMNQISNISALSGLVNMISLDVHDNHSISDLSAVSGMAKLTSLTARHNSIGSVWPLSGLAELSHLDLFENQIGDVSALAGLKSLTYVDLRGNSLNLQACEVDIPQIMADNPGVQISYDRCGPRIILITSTAGGCVISPGEGEFEYENGELVYLEAKADPCFVFASWSGSTTGTTNPMRYTVMGDQQIQANFMSVLEELYVDNDAPGDPKPVDPRTSDRDENGSRNHPFDTIQEAIDVAMDGATILVDRGTYRENINFFGKKIYLVANDPCDAHCGPCATIEGIGAGPVVSIPWGSGSKCGLSGFVITKGKGEMAGGIYCTHASPRINNCLIVGNRCSGFEGAVAYFYDSQAILTNCTFGDNYGGEEGAGLLLEDSDVVVVDSIFWNNKPNEIRRRGTSNPSIRYCDVRGWWADMGNLLVDPLFARPGSWVNHADPNELLGPQDARAVWVDGDYHLKSQTGRWDPTAKLWLSDDVTSPCVDAGDPVSPIGFEPTPNGGIINMGAYGGTTRASKSR